MKHFPSDSTRDVFARKALTDIAAKLLVSVPRDRLIND